MTTPKKTIDPAVEPQPDPIPADELDPNLPAAAGKKDPLSPAVTMGPATVLDIPANEPYPTGSPKEQSYLEINGLVPPAAPTT